MEHFLFCLLLAKYQLNLYQFNEFNGQFNSIQFIWKINTLSICPNDNDCKIASDLNRSIFKRMQNVNLVQPFRSFICLNVDEHQMRIFSMFLPSFLITRKPHKQSSHIICHSRLYSLMPLLFAAAVADDDGDARCCYCGGVASRWFGR